MGDQKRITRINPFSLSPGTQNKKTVQGACRDFVANYMCKRSNLYCAKPNYFSWAANGAAADGHNLPCLYQDLGKSFLSFASFGPTGQYLVVLPSVAQQLRNFAERLLENLILVWFCIPKSRLFANYDAKEKSHFSDSLPIPDRENNVLH